jgi:glycosyltransferase involved in cell wall biosynthesis
MTHILIGNPGRQHSDQLALALQECNLLSHYMHGSPLRPETKARLDDAKREELSRFRLMLALNFRLSPSSRKEEWAHWIYRRFGETMAGRFSPERHGAVVACESSALEPFRAAKRAGKMTILDAASFHHRWQMGTSSSAALQSRNAIKDEEVALADHVLTCSALARQSYLDAGVAPDQCHVLGHGVDVSTFSPSTEPREPGPVRFIYVGPLSRNKGADVLAEACARLRAQAISFSLECIGGEGTDLAQELAPFGTITGKLTHAELAKRYQSADCLIHPSRFDSFAAVVAEALASGIPAIVSDRTGAQSMIREGETGWGIAAGDAGALTSRMAEIAIDPDQYYALRAACRAEAENWTWDTYRKHAGALIARLLNRS